VKDEKPALSTPLPVQPGWRAWPSAAGIAGATFLVGAVALFAHALSEAAPRGSLSLIFLAPVLFSASRYGFWTALYAGALAFLGFNFFFVEPLHTLTVARAEDALTLAIFLLVAAVTGLLAGRLREEADAARRRAEMLEMLSAFAAELHCATSAEAVDSLLLRHLAHAAGGAAIILKQTGSKIALAGTLPSRQSVEPADLLSAEWVFRHGRALSATAAGWSESRFSFHPLRLRGAVTAVFGVELCNAESESVIDAMLRHGELALERMAFARDAEEARAVAEEERMRSALLSSISHDLRTPLATILGSVTSLRELGDAMPPEARGDLLLAIEEETGRLSRFVSNLLAMTQLEAGLDIKREWVDAADVANAAVKRARQCFPAAKIVLEISPLPSLLEANATLLEQALFNLVDNAVKFSPPDKAVRVSVSREHEFAEFSVSDEGPGVAVQDLERIFEKFFRVEGAAAGGAGLGLAIAHGVVTALGGTIHAESPAQDGRGVRMRMRIPAECHA
jgi:two-component system sensor histidine kinase KdpD